MGENQPTFLPRLTPHLFEHSEPPKNRRLRSRSPLSNTRGWESSTSNESSADATRITDVVVRPNRPPPPQSQAAAYPTTQAAALPAVVTLFHEYYLEDVAYTGKRFIELCFNDAQTAGLIIVLLSRCGGLMRRTSMGLLAALTEYDLQAANRLLASLPSV